LLNHPEELIASRLPAGAPRGDKNLKGPGRSHCQHGFAEIQPPFASSRRKSSSSLSQPQITVGNQNFNGLVAQRFYRVKYYSLSNAAEALRLVNPPPLPANVPEKLSPGLGSH
jgi:hypothetical protein